MLTAVEEQTFCPYKGLCRYSDIAGARRAAWSYLDASPFGASLASCLSAPRVPVSPR